MMCVVTAKSIHNILLSEKSPGGNGEMLAKGYTVSTGQDMQVLQIHSSDGHHIYLKDT